MLLATPFVGGHYFPDLAAEVAVTVAGITSRRYFSVNKTVPGDGQTLIGT
jgi:hypothetical protein